MLRLENVTKEYGKNLILEKINIVFDNPSGVYGILGRNGVGKTTLMQMIFNMVPNYDGHIYYQDQVIRDNQSLLENMVYVGGSIYENNGLFLGRISKLFKAYALVYPSFDLKFAENLCHQFNIPLKTKFRKLSTGNKTMIQNIIGLATRVPITILDEPTNGLDSVNRKKFFELLMEDYAEYPRMILISTHLIQEVENYLTHVVILKDTSVLIDEMIEDVQQKMIAIEDIRPNDKKILHTRKLGSKEIYYLFDTLTDEEKAAIVEAGGIISHYDLQTAFNYLVEG